MSEFDWATDRFFKLLVSSGRILELRSEVLARTKGAGRADLNYLKDRGQHVQAHHLEVYGLDPDDCNENPEARP